MFSPFLPLQLLLYFTILFVNVNSQTILDATQEGVMPSQQDSMNNNFQPSLAVVIGMLAIMFSLTFILLLYAKFCHRPALSSVHNTGQGLQILDGLARSRSAASGVDKTLVESLPFFRFSSLKGAKQGLECSVCLAKYEEAEILRLLPKCKHAFHIGCIDQWLEKHSTCPLCRRKVGQDDLAHLASSRSLRFLSGSMSIRDESSNNLEIYVERDEINNRSSSRFSSFRKLKEEELPIQESMDNNNNNCDDGDDDELKEPFHKFNHRINLVSDFVYFKNRWSNVSSSDIMFLNSEMLNDVSSARFSSTDDHKKEQKPFGTTDDLYDHHLMSIKQEMDRKRAFESKLKEIKKTDYTNDFAPFEGLNPTTSDSKQKQNNLLIDPNDKRSMSEIVVHPRFTEISNKDCSSAVAKSSDDVQEERLRKLWLPIARKTVQWFVNRERRPQKSQGLNLQRVDHV